MILVDERRQFGDFKGVNVYKTAKVQNAQFRAFRCKGAKGNRISFFHIPMGGKNPVDKEPEGL